MTDSYLEKPVFICGHRKTGTTMLINLFDGIKNAIVYPDDSGFFYMYYPKWDSNEFSNKEKALRVSSRIIEDNLLNVVNEANCSSKDKEGFIKKIGLFSDFMKNFDSETGSVKDVLKHFINGFHQSFYPEVKSPTLWIEKTTSTEIYALDIVKWFPDAKFIHLIRDPRDNWASLKSGWNKRYKNFNDEIDRLMQSMIERGKLGMEFAKTNESIIGKDRYKVVRYEDLTSNPEKYMTELAEFIGVPFSDTLLKPSTFGYLWEGNNFEGVKNQSASNLNVSRWRDRITDKEAQLIEYYFKDLMHYWDYDISFTDKEQCEAAMNHYKWYNFSTPYSVK